MAKVYYKAKNGLEYAELADANKYGGGAVGKRYHESVKKWEPVYEDLEQSQNTPKVQQTANANDMTNVGVDAPQAANDFDGMDKEQLKVALRSKGYPIKGNPSEATLREKLKLLS